MTCPTCASVPRSVRRQSWTGSVLEEGTKRVVTFAVAMGLNFVVLPRFGYMPTVSESFQITCVFVGASFVVSLILRRIFSARKT